MAGLIRLLLIAAGLVTGALIAPDAPNFQVVQSMVLLLIIAGIVALAAMLWRR